MITLVVDVEAAPSRPDDVLTSLMCVPHKKKEEHIATKKKQGRGFLRKMFVCFSIFEPSEATDDV